MTMLLSPAFAKKVGAEPLAPFNMTLLSQLKHDYEQGDKAAVKYVRQFRAKAEEYATMPLLSVTDKTIVPPSGDVHDYMTLSPYWWPDTTKADGLPYIRHDGKRNPEVFDYPERENGNKLNSAVSTLCILYYITADEYYAEGAVRLLEGWFTNPATAMNPNMTYAQYIPGQKKFRGTGIMDARRFAQPLCASLLLDGSKAMTAERRNLLTAWTERFCDWIENSEQGQMEHHAHNNHGLWYETTHLMLLAYLGRTEQIVKAVREDILPKLDAQIADDGSLPEELMRTLSLHYSTFVLEAVNLANHISSPLGINLWTEKTSGGKCISQALAYLYPYYLQPNTWGYQQIKPFERARAARLLYDAGLSLHNDEYISTARSIGIKPGTKEMESIAYYKMRTN